MAPTPRRIEESSLNAVASLESCLYDGWILRFARGFTGRRNSVNALYPSALNLSDKLDYCEAQFRARNLTPMFRLTPFSSPGNLDEALAARGYGLVRDRVSVLVAPLDPATFPAGQSNITIARQGLEEWLPIHDSIGNIPTAQQSLHRELIARASGQCYFATTYDSIRPAACVLAVREGDLVGIFELVTSADLRRRGHGANILRTVLHWAMQDGARHAYLQVAGVNQPAMALYDKLGFREAYQYWYRAKA